MANDNEMSGGPSRFQSWQLASLAPAMAGIQANLRKQLEPIQEALAASVQINRSQWLNLQQVVGTLSRYSDFAGASPDPTFYSPELTTAGNYFSRHERVIGSFRELNEALAILTEKNSDLPLVWRGAQDADWGLHSSLYRQLIKQNGVIAPENKPKEPQSYPDEDQMVAAEKSILRLARDDWRFDDMSALEIFARVQHVGGPTRLIDVSRNPYIAAWFAVEQNSAHDESDGRLFALATKPVLRQGSPVRDAQIRLDDDGARRSPFWHEYENTPLRQTFDWGTGSLRRLWIPPAYDARILAQNAAFILDGVPMTSSRTAPYFSKGPENENWSRADLLAASSVYVKTQSTVKKPRPNKPNLAPTFTFRVTPAAKRDIRSVLESRFGYRLSSIYPDVSGLSAHLKRVDFSSR
jgi:hypothetical protein